MTKVSHNPVERERVNVGTAGCFCPVTVLMTVSADGDTHTGEVEGTERTEHRPGCWDDRRITDLHAARFAALREAGLRARYRGITSREVEAGLAAFEALPVVDPDPARPTDDTVDSEPHPDEDGPAYYDRDRDERDHEPILPDLSPLDDGPGRDQHGEHGPQYVVDSAEMVGLPAPDFGAVAAHVGDAELETRVRNTIYEHTQGHVSRRLAARQIIAAVRQASPAAYAGPVTLSARFIETEYMRNADARWQVLDGRDEATWHDVTGLVVCDESDCAIAGENDGDCIVLVSTAWLRGRSHFEPNELVDVRIPAVTA